MRGEIQQGQIRGRSAELPVDAVIRASSSIAADVPPAPDLDDRDQVLGSATLYRLKSFTWRHRFRACPESLSQPDGRG